MDQASRVVLANSLKDLTNNVAIIQLLNRTVDVLDFVPNKAQIKDNTFELHPFKKAENHFKTLNTTAIPKATETHTFPENELIRLENVSVSYEERKILNNISWTIKQGEFWQLVGPNGSGKSTILSLITGDNPKGFGQNLFLFGRKKERRKCLGYQKTNRNLCHFYDGSVSKRPHIGTNDSLRIF